MPLSQAAALTKTAPGCLRRSNKVVASWSGSNSIRHVEGPSRRLWDSRSGAFLRWLGAAGHRHLSHVRVIKFVVERGSLSPVPRLEGDDDPRRNHEDQLRFRVTKTGASEQRPQNRYVPQDR